LETGELGLTFEGKPDPGRCGLELVVGALDLVFGLDDGGGQPVDEVLDASSQPHRVGPCGVGSRHGEALPGCVDHHPGALLYPLVRHRDLDLERHWRGRST